MKKLSLLVLFLAFPALLFAQTQVGEEAPDFTLPILDQDQTFTLSDQLGKVVYIFFYGANCPHCQTNGPVTEQEIHQVFIDNEQFVAVGLDTWNASLSANRAFQSTTRISYPLLLNAQQSLVQYYGSSTFYDRSVVVDHEGILRYKGTGFVNSDYEEVVATIQNILSEITTNTEAQLQVPEHVALQQNYPNPFNPSTIIRFELDQASNIELSVFNALGSKVATISEGFHSTGLHSVSWQASGLPSGVYYYRLITPNTAETRKMMLIK